MTINDKIKHILIDKNITPSYFADEIGVQRSSISHILSGRNRPSFDIIQKIIRRFPDLGYEWIMEDNSHKPSATSANYTNRESSARLSIPNRYSSVEAVRTDYGASSRKSRSEPVMPTSTTVADSPADFANNTRERKVERILIFYTDGSFREYTSSV